MLYIISSPKMLQNEASLINDLFDQGMPVLHMRKPFVSEKEIRNLLENINPDYYTKISLHQHHSLCNDFNIKRLHFPEVHRMQKNAAFFSDLKKSMFVLSTSIHTLSDFHTLNESFDYTFLSPVFSSISKPDYQKVQFDLSLIPKERSIELIALGGITSSNCKGVLKMGYNGFGVLGAIWESTAKNKELKELVNSCLTNVQ